MSEHAQLVITGGFAPPPTIEFACRQAVWAWNWWSLHCPPGTRVLMLLHDGPGPARVVCRGETDGEAVIEAGLLPAVAVRGIPGRIRLVNLLPAPACGDATDLIEREVRARGRGFGWFPLTTAIRHTIAPQVAHLGQQPQTKPEDTEVQS